MADVQIGHQGAVEGAADAAHHQGGQHAHDQGDGQLSGLGSRRAGQQGAAHAGAQGHDGAHRDVGAGGGGHHQSHADGQDGHLAAPVQDVDDTAVEHVVLDVNLKEVVEVPPLSHVIDDVDAQHQQHAENGQEQLLLGEFFQLTHVRSHLPQ